MSSDGAQLVKHEDIHQLPDQERCQRANDDTQTLSKDRVEGIVDVKTISGWSLRVDFYPKVSRDQDGDDADYQKYIGDQSGRDEGDLLNALFAKILIDNICGNE